ncbi:TetR/AcrR family transcriptional regulator [Actinomyces viscosus]|uniref:DNA-binding transcriptional repressor AcrR n=1 Tax=Actinomyces viscosus TaxID=1656 RepID=A0A3S4V446_ACTVI|nr:TetR/AcrR family transcriptional regulator [Actinomyces viscosus]VEI18309.1 DNA-binding transcriptional repressor AcrR [Actinomyces viscosus]
MAAKRTRMSASERREQLIAVARGLFAERGFDATSVEEVAARAQVSKPVVYEHFGGKEGLYAVVVDREITTISAAISSAITDPAAGPGSRPAADPGPEGPSRPSGSDTSGSASQIAERAALALLTYIEDSPDGFRILSAGSDRAAGTYSTLLADVAIEVSGILASQLAAHDLDPRTAPLYAQMLVGIVAMPAQWWLENRAMSKEEVAAHMVNLAWNGLRGMKARPTLHSDPTHVPDASEDSENSEETEETGASRADSPDVPEIISDRL